MSITLDDLLNEMGPERRRRVEAQAQALLAELDCLAQLREAIERTQASIGERLGVNREDLSRLEQPSDLLLSTLSRYIAEQGGRLSMVVEYPDRLPIALTNIHALEDDYHDPDDADFELSSLAGEWAASSEEKPVGDDSHRVWWRRAMGRSEEPEATLRAGPDLKC